MTWRSLETGDGSTTLVHPVHGEAFHSRAGAWEEARERYARACGLPSFRGRTFRLLDVGTGLGLNLAAAIEALEGTGARLEAVTLERDATVVEAGLSLPQPPELSPWLAEVRARLASGSIRLVLGDARQTLPALDPSLRFDAVFLDPFSPRVEPELWSPDFLAEVARRMAPGSLLSTYSAATAVRAGLLAAGLRVGPGGRVGTKSEGTLASPDRFLESFDDRARRRIERRSAGLSPAGRLPPVP
ncbi:MAG: tRNA (5-methylaminomethyl-2-thiouridine)(34)-methyltransferase MnmD [Planctomycetota bacterium]